MKLDEVVKGYVLEAETHARYYREADYDTGIRNYDDYWTNLTNIMHYDYS